MLDVVQREFGGKVRENGECHHWELTDAPGMRKFLEFILPYLRIKKRIATLALAFARLMKPRGKRLTNREKLLRERILMLVSPDDQLIEDPDAVNDDFEPADDPNELEDDDDE